MIATLQRWTRWSLLVALAAIASSAVQAADPAARRERLPVNLAPPTPRIIDEQTTDARRRGKRPMPTR